jgi:hypothetical protein
MNLVDRWTAPRLDRTHVFRINWKQLTNLFPLLRPFYPLGMQPTIQVPAAYAAIIFSVYYLFLTTVSRTFGDIYVQFI